MPKMNTSADRDRRQMFGNTRGRDLYWGFTIGVFANLATLFLIVQGGDLPQLAMTAAIVGIFVFVMINSFDCLDDFKANTDDMDEEEADRVWSCIDGPPPSPRWPGQPGWARICQ